MKKVGVLFLGIISLSILVGCGNTKTLTCTQTSEEGLEGKVVIKFKDEKIVSGEQTMKMILPEGSEEYFDTLKEALNSSTESLKDIEGIEVNSQDNGKNEAEVSVSFDYDKLNDYAKDELSLSDADSYDELKTNFEDLGFICE